MIYPIESAEKVSAGTAAKEVNTACRGFLLKNMSDNATVYFKEAYFDGVAATADNAFALAPLETTPVVLRANKLSLIASATADVRILYVGEGF